MIFKCWMSGRELRGNGSPEDYYKQTISTRYSLKFKLRFSNAAVRVQLAFSYELDGTAPLHATTQSTASSPPMLRLSPLISSGIDTQVDSCQTRTSGTDASINLHALQCGVCDKLVPFYCKFSKGAR